MATQMGTTRETACWNDNWLSENIDSYCSYKELLTAYNTLFNTSFSLSGIKNHCRIALKLKKRRQNYKHFTEEQLKFLQETYPRYGQRKTLELFNEKFHEARTMSSMKNFGTSHGCKVFSDVRQKNRRSAIDSEKSSRKTRCIGDTRIECGRLVMKSSSGKWKSATRVIYEVNNGAIPEGYVVTALDGNNSNIDLNNLVAIPQRYLGLLAINNLRSENPIITKTGIVWCDLKEAHEKAASDGNH